MKYTQEDFFSDLKNPELLHIKSKERFIAFYEELGKLPVQKKQEMKPRSDFIEPVGDILELGCHVGFHLMHFAKLGHNATGVDISSTLLAEAQIRKNRLPKDIREQVTLIHSDILDLGDIGKFDTIILTAVLEHVIEPFSILEKSIQYMKPASKIYVSAPIHQIGNFSHVRGVPPKWVKKAGNELGINFTFIPNGIMTQAIGTLV